MATTFAYIIVAWVGMGIGIGITTYIMLGTRFMDDIRIERNIKSPQKMLAEWVQE